MATPDRDLVRLLGTLSPVELQRRLLSTADRELALSMQYLSDAERGRLLDRIGAEKAGRIRSELGLLGRLNIRYADYRTAIVRVIQALESGRAAAKLGSYIRPRGRG